MSAKNHLLAWSLILFAVPNWAQEDCNVALQLLDTTWHCSNDPLAISPGETPCLSAFSLELDGGNDRVQWNTNENHLLGSTRESFTLSSWWRMEDDPNNELQFLWEEGDASIGWNVHLDGDSLRAGWWNEGDSSMWISAAYPADNFLEWTHLAVVGDLDGGTLTLYVDQVALGSTEWQGLDVHPGTAVLGAGGTSQLSNGDTVQPGGGGGPGGGGIQYEWTGWTDEVGYWSIALDSLQRLDATACPLNVEDGIEAAWLFEPAPDYAAWDFSGNGWNGNLPGSDLVNDTPDAWPQEYSWSNGSTSPGLLLDFGGGAGGSDDEGWYTVVITFSDSTTCIDSTFVVDWNPSVIVNVTPPTCFGLGDASVTALLDGGTPPYTLTINNDANPDSLSPGPYQIEVIDANGCEDDLNIQVFNPEGMDWSFAITPDDCSSTPIGAAILDTIFSTNGPASIDFQGQDLTALPGGNLVFVATDSIGCQQEVEINIPVDLSTCNSCEDIDLVPDTVWDCFQGPILITATNLDCPNLFTAYFDGGNDRVELGHAEGGGGGPGGGNTTPANPLYEDEVVAMTISVEFNPEELDDQQIIYVEGDEDAGLALYLDGGTLWGGWWDANSDNPEGVWTSIDGAEAGQWQRAGWSCNATQGELWVALEGVGFSGISFVDTLGLHPGGGVIGATGAIRLHDGESEAGGGGPGGGWNHEFEGFMDQFAIWDVAMDSTTWSAVTFCPNTTLEANLMAYHRFESDAGDVSVDEGYAQVNGNYAGSDIDALESQADGNYLWSNGSTEPFAFVNGNNQGNEYTVYYSNAGAGCIDTVVVVGWNPEASLVDILSPSCYESNDGSVLLTLDGGVAPYSWTVFGEANPDSLSVGNYIAEVVDANGCSDITQFEIEFDIPWDVDITIDPVLCLGDSSASGQAVASGPLGPWLYSWNGELADSSGLSTSLTVGTQVLTVTDSNGCSADFETEVETGNQTLNASLTVTPPPCTGETGGVALLGVSGGIQPYDTDWGILNPTNIPPGTYSILISDGNGCEIEEEFTIPESAILELLIETTDISCYGEMDGSIDVDAVEDNGGYAINWNGAGEEGIGVSAGTYIISAVDALGCTDTIEVTIIEPDPINPGILSGPGPDLQNGVEYTYVFDADIPFAWDVVWEVSGGSILNSTDEEANVVWSEDEVSLCAYILDNDGCASETVCLGEEFVFSGMDESTVNVLTVFPQPAEGWLQLQWKTPASPTEVKVFNSVGALAAQIQWNTLTTALDVYSWPSGVYLMTLTNESGIIRRPIMVH
jgi:hypothetical protein